jgi:hypothetical protein
VRESYVSALGDARGRATAAASGPRERKRSPRNSLQGQQGLCRDIPSPWPRERGKFPAKDPCAALAIPTRARFGGYGCFSPAPDIRTKPGNTVLKFCICFAVGPVPEAGRSFRFSMARLATRVPCWIVTKSLLALPVSSPRRPRNRPVRMRPWIHHGFQASVRYGWRVEKER